MDYKIVEKDSFTVMGVSRVFKYDSATTEIPQFWTEHYQMGNGKIVCGMYGVSIDESMSGNEFEYLIADNLFHGRISLMALLQRLFLSIQER